MNISSTIHNNNNLFKEKRVLYANLPKGGGAGDFESSGPKENHFMDVLRLIESGNLEGVDKPLLDRMITACIKSRDKVPDKPGEVSSFETPEETASIEKAATEIETIMGETARRRAMVTDGLALPENEKLLALKGGCDKVISAFEKFAYEMADKKIINPAGEGVPETTTDGKKLLEVLHLDDNPEKWDSLPRLKEKIGKSFDGAKEAWSVGSLLAKQGTLSKIVRVAWILEGYFPEIKDETPYKEAIDAVNEFKLLLLTTTGAELVIPKLYAKSDGMNMKVNHLLLPSTADVLRQRVKVAMSQGRVQGNDIVDFEAVGCTLPGKKHYNRPNVYGLNPSQFR